MNKIDIVELDNNRHLFYLVKFLEEKSHADNFINGNIYLGHLESYLPISKIECSHKYDTIEGVTAINYIKSLSLAGRSINVVNPKPGGNPNSFSTGNIEYSHILSMSCISDIPTKALFLGTVFDERLYQFGEHVIFVHNKGEFLRRLQNEIKNISYQYAWNKVEYVPSHFSGYMNVFKKVDEHHGVEYSYQQEWRLACLLDQPGKLEIKIGDISDIAVYMPREKITNRIIINADESYRMVL